MSDYDDAAGEELGPCSYCGGTVLNGDLRYTAGESRDPPVYAHGRCKAAHDAKLVADLRAMDRKVARLGVDTGGVGARLADLLERLKV